jgi:hypothetical protein
MQENPVFTLAFSSRLGVLAARIFMCSVLKTVVACVQGAPGAAAVEFENLGVELEDGRTVADTDHGGMRFKQLLVEAGFVRDVEALKKRYSFEEWWSDVQSSD